MAQHGKPRSGCFAEQFCIVSSHAPCPLPSLSSSLPSPPLTVVHPVHGPWAELGHAIIVGIANLAETPQCPLSHAPYSLVSSSLLPATNTAVACHQHRCCPHRRARFSSSPVSSSLLHTTNAAAALIDRLVSLALPFRRCCCLPPMLPSPSSMGLSLWPSHCVVHSACVSQVRASLFLYCLVHSFGIVAHRL